ncbi:MAG: hypothetical protein IT338_04280 [Thermomicrobiales bacterium]|nr:hypothetical protein [Thermomicrobiales bacterium]
MDDAHFDNLTRALRYGTTRRAAVAAMLTGLGLPLFPAPEADAKPGKKKRRRGKHRKQGKGGDKVTICHKPGTSAAQTLVVAASAVKAHLAHGDHRGACDGASCDPANCPAPTNPCREAFCNDAGDCDERDKADGAACDAGDLCTINDTCAGGICQKGQRRACPPFDAQCQEGYCDSQTGACNVRNKLPGTPCDDGNPCTTNDMCNFNGVCEGTPKYCPGVGQICCASGPYAGQCKGGDGASCSNNDSSCCSGNCLVLTCFGE